MGLPEPTVRSWLGHLRKAGYVAADRLEVSRQEENIGNLRRQFVTVPVQSLPEGRYKLEIRVRDLVAGDEVVRSALFVNVGTGG